LEEVNAFLDDDHPKIIIYVNSIPDISFINTNGGPAGSRVKKVQKFIKNMALN
jgi:hypothetical protein